ncbi:GNAT family N-acetyltransferase [Clostridium sp. D2Q-11]|uniref:GNAT family N-acetyltransferase n=1 Tax=Anaeromonas frigoriresistens TaxID=2683708 RepID=A0A942Z9E4_9FIRM|nr:GNAT family N-acetyltransferase [Anaeromonas frigoriresistens]MBS4538790.1 GNAT family N-acetyltransferase [Anaeromonas frigoriresistens]
MREIRKLNEEYIDEYTEIAFNAYPSFKDFTKKAMDKYKKEALDILKNDSVVTFYGMFENDKLIGVMRLFDFEMNFFGKIIPVSGIGFLGVHLMHKKKKVARDMLEFYEKHYKNKNVPLGLLLPFRPDFYKKMGYGFGTKMNQYRLPTERLPEYRKESDIRYINEDGLEKILDCHNRVVEKTHGMMKKFGDEIRQIFGDEFNRVIGSYDKEGNIEGYIVFKFLNGKEGNYTINNIYMKELVYENPEVLRKLLGFLRKQDDQVHLIIFNTEDENFYYLFDDPRNDSLNYIPYGYLETNTQAVGVMYKIFDIREAFIQCSHRSYNKANIRVRFLIEDSFIAKKEEEIIVKFENGRAILDEEKFDVTVKMDISDFSSLFLGATSLKGLWSLGLVEIDKGEYLDELDRAFYYSQKPVCYTDF